MLRTFIFLLTFYPWTLIAALLALVISLSGQDRTHSFVRFWGRSGLFLAGLTVEVRGTENILTDRPAIYVSNHQSNFDILALFAGLPVQFRWLAKAELFKIPIFSHGMRGCGYICIDRSNREAAFQSIEAAAEKIKNGVSVMIFPEGTRSPDGRLLPLKKGGFVLAAKSKVPVVPMIITGSLPIMPKKRIKIKSGVIMLDILTPVDTAPYEIESKHELLDVVSDIMKSALKKKEEGQF